MKVKEESEKCGLKLNIQKMKICFGNDMALLSMKHCRSLLAQLNEPVPAIPGRRGENLVDYVSVSLIQFMLI